VPHSRIVGRVVDAGSGEPVAGARLWLHSSSGSTAETNSEGRFEFTPHEEWRFFMNLPLLPFEFWWLCGDQLHIEGPQEPAYRRHSIQVNSCPVPFFFAYSRRENLDLSDNLESLQLHRLPQDFRRE
jgi:hypothetical protein